jgi:hypothetical protein
MQIDPSESELIGQWVPNDQGCLVADATCRRIEELVRAHLMKIGRDASGWDLLYRNRDDGTLWELTQLAQIRRSVIDESMP